MPEPKLHFQRFEIKYQIPSSIIEGMIPEFLKYMEPDPYAKNLPDKAYTVASSYYDSVGLDCYYQKIAGIKTRKKLRVRFYPNFKDFKFQPDTQVFLEIKRKYNMVVIKDRFALNHKNCYDLLKQNKINSDLKNKQSTLNEFLWLKIYNGMLPQNMVIYQRKPFISKVDQDFRVTIDYNLRTFLSDWLSVDKNWFQGIIQRYGLEHKPFSKYCNCLEVCRPKLINNI